MTVVLFVTASITWPVVTFVYEKLVRLVERNVGVDAMEYDDCVPLRT